MLAALADPALLPDNFSCDHPDWRNQPGYMHYDTPCLLICDNLLDFSHLSYVHAATLGGSTAIAQAVPKVEPVPGARPDWPVMGIRVSRHVPDVPAPPFYQRFRNFDSHLDRWFIYDFLLPGTLLMHSGGKPVGDDYGDMRRAAPRRVVAQLPDADARDRDQHALLLSAVAPRGCWCR